MDGKTLRYLTLSLMALVLFGSCILSYAKQGTKVSDARSMGERAIRENVKQLEDGWNAKSGARHAAPFAEDADYVNAYGKFLTGRAEIAKDHQRIFDTFYKDTSLQLSIKQIRFLRPDVAVVHVVSHLRRPVEGDGNAAITMIMVKESRGWEIKAFQLTGISEPRR